MQWTIPVRSTSAESFARIPRWIVLYDEQPVTVDREDSIERLLKRGRPTADASSELCLDPETIGAWLDGTLLPAQRAAAETHAAIARAESVLAAMVRTEPPKEHQAWWRSGALRWIAPLALAEAALLAWLIVVPSRPEVPVQQAAKNVDAVASTAEPSPRDEAAAKHAAAPRLPTRSAGGGSHRASGRIAPHRLLHSPQPLFRQSPHPLLRRSPHPLLRQSRHGLLRPLPHRLLRKEMWPIDSEPRRLLHRLRPRTKSWKKAGAAAPLDVASPIDDSPGRVLPTGVVERTTDGGVTWTAQEALPRFAIQAGRSPAPDVIWLVGNDGLGTRVDRWPYVAAPQRRPAGVARGRQSGRWGHRDGDRRGWPQIRHP